MSYQIWHNYGYGFKMDNLDQVEITRKNMNAAISVSPTLQAIFKELPTAPAYIQESEDDEPVLDTDEMDNILYLYGLREDWGNMPGCVELYYSFRDVRTFLLWVLLNDLAKAKYHWKPFSFVEDCDGTQYIMHQPVYPWKMSAEATHPKSEDELVELYRKAIVLLFGEHAPIVEIDYMTVENGG